MTIRRFLAVAFTLQLTAIGAGVLFGRAVVAQEVHTLTVPTSVTTTTYTITNVVLDAQNSRIRVELVSNTGVILTKVYDSTTTPTGATLLHTLNTSNFSVNSLIKQAYNRLVTDGVIPAGSVGGTPQ